MKRLITGIVILLTAGISAVLFSFVKITCDQKSILSVYQGKKAELPEFHASFFDLSLDQYLIVTDGTDYETPGEYEVKAECVWFGIPVKTMKVVSSVVDADAPRIVMADDVILFSRVNDDWSMPAYEVSDNWNSPEEITVTISGEADNTREGIYEGNLTACDSSGNCSYKPLTVVIGSAGEEDLEPGRFDLSKLDNKGVLLSGREGAKDRDIYEDLYWMGDSNILNLGKYNGVKSDRVLARYGMTPATFDLPLYYDNRQTNLNAVQLISRLQPDYLIVMMGEAEAAGDNPIALAEHYYDCIRQLMEASPDTKIIVSAILPVCREVQKNAADQRAINTANYCLLRMCTEHDIPMICANEYLMGKDGYGNPEYYNEDGFHLRAVSFDRYTGYVKNALNSSGRIP